MRTREESDSLETSKGTVKTSKKAVSQRTVRVDVFTACFGVSVFHNLREKNRKLLLSVREFCNVCPHRQFACPGFMSPRIELRQ